MSDPVVTISEGKIRGNVDHGDKGDMYYSFLGIPYAEPPVGNLRFKAPRPPKPWTGIRDAKEDGNPSIQEGMSGQLIGSEDCLYLNVFTPNLPIDANKNQKVHLKPVILYFHGGYFLIGSNKKKIFGPQFLITKDVILVTLNFRLGILGMLSCEDESLDIPGNASFKDMVLALKWIKKNIVNFMGDPDNITLMGQSAGAVAVHLLMFSPCAKDLYHKAIMQSCSLFIPATYSKYLKHLAADFGFEGKTEKEIMQYLRNCPVDGILKLQTNIETKSPNGNGKRFIGLTIEKPGPAAFISQHPLELLQSGYFPKIPILMGYNSNEGVIIEIVMQKYDVPLHKFWTETEMLIPFYWNVEKGSPESLELGRKIIQHYFPKGHTLEQYRHGVHQLHADFFTWCLLKSVRLHSQKCSVYLYRNVVETQLNLFKSALGTENPGVYHGDELGYLFHSMFTPEIEQGSIEDLTQRRFVTLWTNFAKFGNPTPFKDHFVETQWTQTDPKSLDYLEIGTELTMKSHPDEDRIEFWDKLELLANFFASKL